MTHGVLAHHAETPARIAQLIASERGAALGHAVKSFALCLQMRTDLAESIADSIRAAELALRDREPSDAEGAVLAAARSYADGRPFDALRALDARLARAPSDLLVMKLGHALHFIVGDRSGMRLAIDAAVAAQPDDLTGRGFALGCQAFARIESGEIDEGERVGRRAVDLQPDDAWGAHAVAHALAARRRPSEGVAWLRRCMPALVGANNFLGHVAWHEALFQLALGADDEALAIYDTRIVTHLAGDYRDMVNAVTLLARLRRRGHDVRDRAARLAAHADARRGDHGSAFADLHYLLALADHDAVRAREFATSMRAASEARRTHEAEVARDVACDLADAILALRDGRDAVRAIEATRARWNRLGGSRIQREAFDALLAEARGERGNE